jgi:hypothetical protein
MSQEFAILGFVLGLFAGVLAFMELGRQLALRGILKQGSESNAGAVAVEGSVFALLGLLLAFTFSVAASRFESRRQLIVSEANAIGTAYLRLDLLPAETRDNLRESFRRYVDARLEIYRHASNEDAAQESLDRALAIQDKIWSQAVAACRESSATQTSMLLLPAINEMIDLTTSRMVGRSVHQPFLIFSVIALLAFACAALAGHDMAALPGRRWFHRICFASMVALTIYVILDLEYPRSGLIRIDSTDRVLEDVRSSMK